MCCAGLISPPVITAVCRAYCLHLKLTLMKSLIPLLSLCLCLPAMAEDKPAPKSIEHLVSMTLALNPELQYYEAEILAAKAVHRVAGKPDNPQLSTDSGRMRVVNLSDSDPTHMTSIGVGYAVTLAQPIEWPGRLGLRKAIANGDVILAELGLARFRSFLAGRVRSLGWQGLAIQRHRETTNRHPRAAPRRRTQRPRLCPRQAFALRLQMDRQRARPGGMEIGDEADRAVVAGAEVELVAAARCGRCQATRSRRSMPAPAGWVLRDVVF